MGTSCLSENEGYVPQTLLFYPLFSPQSEVTKRFRLTFSKSEVCVRSGNTNFLYTNGELLDIQSIQGILEKALKAFQNNNHFNIACGREYCYTETEPCTEMFLFGISFNR